MQSSLIDEIKIVEEQSRLLDPPAEVRALWNAKTYDYAENFLQDIPTRKAYQATTGISFSELTEKPTSLDSLLQQFSQHLDHNGIDTASGRYLGFIPGGGLYPSALGDYIAAVTNRYSGVFFASPGAVQLENQLLDWLIHLVGFPKTAAGNLTSGGSVANLIAIVTAREACHLRGKDYAQTVVYLTQNTHTSMQKALRVAGMGEVLIRFVPVDARYRMRVEELQMLIEKDRAAGLRPWLIVASAGTTDTGSIDPLQALANLAKSESIWLHVDAAYGGFFLLTSRGKELLRGIERADSVILDPHKGLFLPYGIGAVLIRAGHLQRSAFSQYAACLQDCTVGTEWSPADLSPELTRHFRALRMWLPLQLFGIAAFRAALQEKLLLANYFYQELQQFSNVEIACVPELSIVAFRFHSRNKDINQYNADLLQAINADGRVYFSSTSLHGEFYIRMACLSFRTHLAEIKVALDVIRVVINAASSIAFHQK